MSLETRTGRPLHAGVRYALSGVLGGTGTSSASLSMAVFSATGRRLATRSTGTVEACGSGPGELGSRTVSGTMPAGAASAEITLTLATSLRNIDGPEATTGYNRAVADDLRFAVGRPVRGEPALRPPVAHVPHFDHVFLFYFENEDYGKVIGNTRQAPFLNSLLPRSSSLAQMFAEEHPSDGNYLALAGGSAFGIPLNDPLEINPRYTIHARNLGHDRVRGKSRRRSLISERHRQPRERRATSIPVGSAPIRRSRWRRAARAHMCRSTARHRPGDARSTPSRRISADGPDPVGCGTRARSLSRPSWAHRVSRWRNRSLAIIS